MPSKSTQSVVLSIGLTISWYRQLLCANQRLGSHLAKVFRQSRQSRQSLCLHSVTSFALHAKATRIPRLTPLKYLFFGVFLKTRSIYGAFTPVFKHFPQLFRLLIRYVLLEALYATHLGMVPEVHYWN